MAQLDFAIGQHFKDARHGAAIRQLRLFGERRLLGLRDFKYADVALGNLGNHHVPKMIQQIADQPDQLLAARGQFMQLPQCAGGICP